jgi:hypothetical protein
MQKFTFELLFQTWEDDLGATKKSAELMLEFDYSTPCSKKLESPFKFSIVQEFFYTILNVDWVDLYFFYLYN